MIRFLADACCDALVVRTLRALAYDVAFVAETEPDKSDEAILGQSLEEQRVILTEDRDFCTLVFRDRRPAYGIVLMRIPPTERPRRADRITTLVAEYPSRLPGSMTTLSLTNIRIRPLPTPPDSVARHG
ncbi:MAG: DUF5615 family PIN-like protein [Anaerolineae bacterium]